MTTATLTPATLDQAAARLVNATLVDDQFARIAAGYQRTAPASTSARSLVSMTVDELVDEALGSLPAPLPAERPLPGRLGAVLPDRFHSWRRIGQADIRPSTHLAYARRVIAEWGWQNDEYKLRNRRGERCVCGALISAHRLGYGSAETMHRAAGWIHLELKASGWTGLIGPWNRAPGRTQDDALQLIDSAARTASLAGE